MIKAPRGCGSRRWLWKWLFTCSAESQGAEEGEGLMTPIGVFPQGTVTHLNPSPATRGCAAPFCKHTQPLATPQLVPGAGTCRGGRRKRSDFIHCSLEEPGCCLRSQAIQGGGDAVPVLGERGPSSPGGEWGGRCALRLPALHIPGWGSSQEQVQLSRSSRIRARHWQGDAPWGSAASPSPWPFPCRTGA